MTTFATLAEPSLSAISEAGMQTTCAWEIAMSFFRSSGSCSRP